MTTSPKETITAEHAFKLISAGEMLNNLFISGILHFNNFYKDSFKNSVVANNCIFEHLQATCAQFAKQVKLTNCEIKKCQFDMTWFLGGLSIDNCVFDNYLSFEAGGHNEKGNIFSIRNSTFKKFVNFFDCLFLGEVLITNNNFLESSNLLGAPNFMRVRFQAENKIENNKGKLDRDDEGDIGSASVYLEPGRRTTNVLQMPEFLAGGKEGLHRVIRDNMKYPESALKDNVGGEVIVKFTVDETGNVTDIKIDKCVRKDIDDEAMRVVGLLNGWKPGMQNDEKVKVVYKIPIHFSPKKN